MTCMTDLAVYYEGGTVDCFWVAPAGLGLVEARKQRIGRRYKTRWGATQLMLRAR